VRSKDWRNYRSQRRGNQFRTKKKRSRSRIRKLKGERGRKSMKKIRIRRLFIASMIVKVSKLPKK